MDKKPNVFPTQNQQNSNNEQTKLEAYEAEKKEVANEIYSTSISPTDTPIGHIDAVELMRKRTEEQMKLRDEQLKKNMIQTENFQQQTDDASTRHLISGPINAPQVVTTTSKPLEPSSPTQTIGTTFITPSANSYIQELSQPQFNAPFDVIPLPSEGKLYKNKRPNVRVAYMTTADENILTSPNLLQSGEFLEILINRKLLEPELRYKDLHPGDRNAIMIWLRATGYGEMYPVTLLDDKDVPFEAVVNLNDLKTKNLNVSPDAEGLFDMTLPMSKAQIKFKLLNVGDIEEIEKLVDADKVNNVPVNNTTTYTMERTIVEVNGDRNKNSIKDFVSSLRIRDGKELREYIDSIDSGIDLDITVGTPGGGSIKTFLPLNLGFFWPNIQL